MEMDWLKELLGEDLFKQVLPKIGDKKIILNDGTYIPIAKFNEKNEEVKILKGQIKDYENKSKDVETLLKDNDSLKEKYESLNSKYNTDLEAKNREISSIVKKSVLSKKLKESGAVYEDLILKALDLDKIELDGENIKNFNVDDVKKQYPGMFAETSAHGNVNPGASPNNNLGGTQKEKLIQQYNEFEKAGNFAAMLQIQDQIKKLE